MQEQDLKRLLEILGSYRGQLWQKKCSLSRKQVVDTLVLPLRWQGQLQLGKTLLDRKYSLVWGKKRRQMEKEKLVIKNGKSWHVVICRLTRAM